MDILFLVQIIGLVVLIALLVSAIITSHKTIMRLNYAALLVGAVLILTANLTHIFPICLDGKLLSQMGITVIIIVVAGLVPSLKQVEMIWNIKI